MEAELAAAAARNRLLQSIVEAFMAETDEVTFGRVRARIERLDAGERGSDDHRTAG
jgi:hypothetical protein